MPTHEFTPQRALTVLAPIHPDRVKSLRAVLETMVPPHNDVETNPMVPFESIRGIHFARFVIVQQSYDATDALRDIGPWLLFSTNFDGSLRQHYAELMRVARPGLNQIFQNCTGWPATGSEEAQIRYLRRFARSYEAFFVGYPGLSVEQITAEEKLREEIGVFLDANPALRRTASGNPAQVRTAIVGHLRNSPFNWALTPAPPRPLTYTLFRWYGWLSLLKLLSKVALFVVLLWLLSALPSPPSSSQIVLIGALIIAVLMLVLRYKEEHDPQLDRLRYDPQSSALLVSGEDKIVQNQMTILVDIKAGPFRTVLLKTVLNVIDFLARYKYVNGKLGDIPSIHFARWVIIDQGRALLFLSNFTGSWENYLGDFIEKAAIGLTAVWSNTVLFPRTKWLAGQGAKDERRFKVWTRSQQMPTDVWFSAYKNLSSVNIQNNRAIREGLSATFTTSTEFARWVQRL